MIAERNSATRVEGTMTGEKIAMDFDHNSLPHLQSILIGMYADPELAMIREIATNGRDATIEAGLTRPVEVTTPSSLSPFLKIRDFGCGLSVEDIRNVFSKYGASTKRDTNDQTGMLGIGSKSPLAYQPQFTVVSIKDGRRVQVAIGLDDEGAGMMTVVDEAATTEPNGTEVVIPAKRVNSIASKARNLFGYWPKGSVLLDGEEVESVTGEEVLSKPATRTTVLPTGKAQVTVERMLITSGQRTSYVVMGGVPYPVTPETHNKWGLGYTTALTVFVSIGDVHFAPSREALKMTERTKAALDAIGGIFKDEGPRAIQRAIDTAANPAEALKAMLRWNSIMPSSARKDEYRFRGRTLPAQFRLPVDAEGKAQTIVTLDENPHKLNRHRNTEAVSADQLPNSIWFYGYDPKVESWTSGKRKKLDKWCEDNKVNTWPRDEAGAIQASYFLLVAEKPDMTFLDPSRVLPWEPVKAVKLPRTVGARAGQSGRIPGSYDMYVGGDKMYGVPADDIDTSNPVYYFNTTHEYENHSAVELLTHYEADCTIVLLQNNRIPKFLRYFPDAKRVRVVVEECKKEWLETLPKDMEAKIAFSDDADTSTFRALANYEIEDPAIKEAIAMCAQDEALTKVLKERKLFQYVGIPTFPSKWTCPLGKYPLFDRYTTLRGGTIKTNHMVTYMNAAYREHFAPEAQTETKTTGDTATN